MSESWSSRAGELSKQWSQMLTSMENHLGHQDVEIWLKSSFPVRLDGNVLVLEVANRYYADWIEDNYQQELLKEAKQVFNKPIEIEYVFREDATTEFVTPNESNGQATDDEIPHAHAVNTNQSFDNFVIGECNKFAHAAAAAVADFPAKNYNPLFIYGSTGLGKTHLLHAIANKIYADDPKGARIVYVTAEDFMNDMINCLRYKRMEDFRSKYRKRATLLLVDDIQFLSGKERTQEEFFHTFNALQNSDRQIVLTSDVVPKEIEKLEPRLRTRFEGGLLADLQAPDKETLIAILLQKSDLLGMNIPNDLANLIADTVCGNIRELEGILNRLSALHSFYHEPLTIEFALRQLPALFNPVAPTVTVSGIIEGVARFHNLRSADITGSKRTKALTHPRHIAMYLARKHTDFSFPELGKEFGGRDHSTIQHGYRKIEKEIDHDPDLPYKLRLIEKGLNIK